MTHAAPPGRDAKGLTRRACLIALGGAGASLGAPRSRAAVVADAPPRVVSLNWALAETLVAIGHPPVGTVDTTAYRRWVEWPPLPGVTQDLGSRFEPNLEEIHRLRPDVVFIVPYQMRIRHLLERIAPVEVFDIYGAGGSAIARVFDTARAAARQVGRGAEGEALVARTEARLAAAAERLRPLGSPRVLLASLLDVQHARVYGPNSALHETMGRLGLANAWTGRTNAWGFATVGLPDLAGLGAQALVILSPLPRGLDASLFQGPLWRDIGIAAEEVHLLPTVATFGGPMSLIRFADLLEAAFAPASKAGR